MIKPKITEGEWMVDQDPRSKMQLYRSVNNGDEDICYVCHDGTEYNLKGLADAKAITAVPEMISALTDCYHLIQALKKTGEWGVNVHEVDEENVKQALEKAGCEF